MYLKKIFPIIIFFVGQPLPLDGKNITIYGDIDYKFSLEVEECVHQIPEGFYSRILSIDTHGNCVTLYREASCRGDFIVLPKGSKNTYLASYFGIKWETPPNGTLRVGTTTTTTTRRPYFLRRPFIDVKSIGPCLEKCDHRNIEQNVTEPVQISIFDNPLQTGINKTITLDGCTQIPTVLKRRVFATRIESGEQVCLEFHKQADCMGDFSQARRHAHESFRYYLSSNEYSEKNKAVAISLCGYQCHIESQNISLVKKEEPLLQNHVRIFDDANFKGFSKDLNISDECVNITGDWEGQLMSVLTNGVCIFLYDEFGCNLNSSKNIQIGGNGNYFNAKFSKNIRDIPEQIKSLSKCSYTNQEIDEVAERSPNDPHEPISSANSLTGSSSTLNFFLIFFLSLTIISLVSVGTAYLVLRVRRNGLVLNGGYSNAQLFRSESNDNF